MFFKCGNCIFRSVEAVVVWWDQLDVHLVGLNGVLNCLAALLLSITFSAGWELRARSIANTLEKAAMNEELVRDGIGCTMIALRM